MTWKIHLASLLLAVSTTACAGDSTLKGTFEAQMKDNGYDGYEIIHIQENEGDGWVLHTAWTKDYPENRNEPGINYYQREGKKWQSAMGTACSSNGVARLGLRGRGHLFCAQLREGMSFTSIFVDETEAKMFEMGNGATVWYAVSENAEARVRGVTASGAERWLN